MPDPSAYFLRAAQRLAEAAAGLIELSQDRPRLLRGFTEHAADMAAATAPAAEEVDAVCQAIGDIWIALGQPEGLQDLAGEAVKFWNPQRSVDRT